jgi:choline kinase
MADHILDDKIMALVRDHRPPENGVTLCTDFKLDTIFDIDDATKVLSKHGYIIEIGKNIGNYNCIDTGVFVATDGLMNAIEKIYYREGDASLSQGIRFLAKKKLAKSLDIKDAFWQDVDNLEMLRHAEKLLSRNARGTNRSECN